MCKNCVNSGALAGENKSFFLFKKAKLWESEVIIIGNNGPSATTGAIGIVKPKPKIHVLLQRFWLSIWNGYLFKMIISISAMH